MEIGCFLILTGYLNIGNDLPNPPKRRENLRIKDIVKIIELTYAIAKVLLVGGFRMSLK